MKVVYEGIAEGFISKVLLQDFIQKTLYRIMTGRNPTAPRI